MKTLAIICLLLAGCGVFQRKPICFTPAGYPVYGIEDQGSFKGGYLTREQVLANLDFRIQEWTRQKQADPGVPPDRLKLVLSKVNFWLRDHYMFKDGSSSTGWAAGDAQINGAVVTASIWTQGVSQTVPPEGSPPWMTIYNPETKNWNFGYLSKVDGVARGLDVVGHEMDHLLGITHPR